MLVISGREKEVLNLGGAKVRPQIVEQILTAFNSIDEAAVFAVPDSLGVDELWALIVSGPLLDAKALRAHCEQSLAPAFCPVRFAAVDRLPRNHAGKLERHRLRDFATGPDAGSAAAPRPT